ncbi:hypothetical protein D3C71_1386990 [compost metagenome]
MYAHQNRVFAILTRTKVVLRQRQTANIVPDITGDVETFFQRTDQPPVFNLNMRHITNHAAFRVDQARQDNRDGDQLADFTLAAFNKLRNGIQQGVFQRFLRAFRQGIVFFCHHFAAQIVQSERGVMTTQAHTNGVEIAGFSNDRDGAAAPGGGLLIDFFNQAALNKLTRDFSHAGGCKLALFGNLYARDWTMLVNQAIHRRTVKLFNEVNITNLSLSARCHTFTYSVTTSLPLTMVLIIL